MADLSLTQDECMDDSDEGVFEQGDCSSGSPTDDDILPPLLRVQKYATSTNAYGRQMVARIVQEVFRTAPPDVLSKEIPNIMSIIRNLGEKDEAMVRADLLEQIPHLASQAFRYSHRAECLRDVVGDDLLPLVVRNLGCSDNAVDKAAHSTLVTLLEKGLITKTQAEVQVCPAILSLSNEEQTADISTGAITLMSRIAPLLGRDVTERVFLKRFAQLCSSHMFYVRKVCASHMGDFCFVAGKDSIEKILVPCFVNLCQDQIWGVRKSCAEVIMFVSSACPLELRRSNLAPVFAKLLQDDCRWVQISAFQTLGPFISTFSDPPITQVIYNNQRELVFINRDGDEFLIHSPSLSSEMRFCKLSKQELFGTSRGVFNNDDDDDFGNYMSDENFDLDFQTVDINAKADESTEAEDSASATTGTVVADEDIKEIVETVKNAVLSYRNVEQEHGVIGDTAAKTNNECTVIPWKQQSCDNLSKDSTEEITEGLKNMALEGGEASTSTNKSACKSDTQVIVDKRREHADDDLYMFNSYNYWYIRPDTLCDIDIEPPESAAASADKSNTSDAEIRNSTQMSSFKLEDSWHHMSSIHGDEVTITDLDDLPPIPEQDIVPQTLINHFMLMTDSSFSINVDCDMSYHCAYSLPAVVLTLSNKSWPLLKHTIERLAGDMQYKVRRTLASSLHELAAILGVDIATEHLTPIFDGFIKDLDEVRIGILKNLANFLKIIKPAKRNAYLPRLQEFLKTENDWNWRFRHELATQLLSIVTLFKPVDSAKHLGLIAESLLQDVAAVREVAISLITELLRYISEKPGLNTLYLVRLVETFAHSKKWKRRQTFALLCFNLLSCQTLPPEQFASDIMPHLLDLSWDPVANVRLVVAQTIAQHIIPNEYFADPTNQHYDSLGTVLRRLQADKDRDVRQYAQIAEKSEESFVATSPSTVPPFDIESD